uniref:Uncharacterized protein n=1 Tax=Romanomermis culicivorax TaxID=13658 RepID=A0A915KRB4_ROMCU
MPSKEEALHSGVYKFYSNYLDEGKQFKFSHFKNEGVRKSMLYSILQKFEQRLFDLIEGLIKE